MEWQQAQASGVSPSGAAASSAGASAGAASAEASAAGASSEEASSLECVTPAALSALIWSWICAFSSKSAWTNERPILRYSMSTRMTRTSTFMPGRRTSSGDSILVSDSSEMCSRPSSSFSSLTKTPKLVVLVT